MKKLQAWSGKTYFEVEEHEFKKLPLNIRNELIDLSGLSEKEAVEKMKEILEENPQNKPMTYWDEAFEFPKNIDRKEEVNNLKSLLQKKKTPAYVEQFGENKNNKKQIKRIKK